MKGGEKVDVAMNLNQMTALSKLNGDTNQVQKGSEVDPQTGSVFKQLLLQVSASKFQTQKSAQDIIDEMEVSEEIPGFETISETLQDQPPAQPAELLIGQLFTGENIQKSNSEVDIGIPQSANLSSVSGTDQINISSEDSQITDVLKLQTAIPFKGNKAVNKAVLGAPIERQSDKIGNALKSQSDKTESILEISSDTTKETSIIPSDGKTGSFSLDMIPDRKTESLAVGLDNQFKETLKATGTISQAQEWRIQTDSAQGVSIVNDVSNAGAQIQKVEASEPYSQIGKEILNKLDQKGPMEFKLQLQPKDLGQIDIKMKVNNGKLMIDIVSASSKTQTLLTGQVDKLIMNLGLQNVQVEILQGSQIHTQSQDHTYIQHSGFSTNGSMDFSQRSQRDPLGGQAANQQESINVLKSDQEEMEAVTSETTENTRTGFHKMDYII